MTDSLKLTDEDLEIRVFLCSTFSMLRDGEETPIRIVTVPAIQAPRIENALNAAFHFGQNEIQPQERPSVSCGDVIEIPTDEGPRFYRVRSVGFEELVGAERADEIRGCAAADLGSFGKLLDEPEEGPAIDPMTGDYWAHRVRHANARHFGE